MGARSARSRRCHTALRALKGSSRFPRNRADQEDIRLKLKPLLRLNLSTPVIRLEDTRLDPMRDIVIVETRFGKKPSGVLAVRDRVIRLPQPIEHLWRDRLVVD